jgi:glutathione S-transferase
VERLLGRWILHDARAAKNASAGERRVYSDPMTTPGAYRLYGLTRSYFTRKMSGYFDYKGIPWILCRSGGLSPDLLAEGFPGGIPAARTPEGELVWDSTAMIHHLELRFPRPEVLPPDPVQRFLGYLLEDLSDEWLYRPAVGSRWHFEENASVAGHEIARELTVTAPLSCAQAHEAARRHVLASCPPLGVTEKNIAAWIDEVLKPWLRVLGAHLDRRRFLFGDRPSLADFALFGANAAHFVGDPLCRRWTEAEGPAIVQHTHRLLEPGDEPFGDWSEPADVPETLVSLVAEAGRLYLPWVSRAAVEGSADLEFEHAPPTSIRASDFLLDARRILLARYVALRCEALDEVLDRAGVLRYFADFTAQAGSIPDDTDPPRPELNRPFPPAPA